MTKRKRKRQLVKLLDVVFSRYIRDKFPRCVFCGKKTEHCFHFVTRAKHATRWEEANAVGSCAGCNLRNEYDPHPFVKWYLDNRGITAYNLLVQRSNKPARFDVEELETMLETYRAKATEEAF